MCAPIVPLIAGGLGAIGSGIGVANAVGQARAQAAAADANAQAESNAAQIGQQNLRDAALQQYRQMAAVSGQQRALAAANGDATGYGTAANALNDTQILGQESLARLYTQGNQNLMGADIAVANDLGQAAMDRSKASAALVGGLFSAASGLAGGNQFGMSQGSGGSILSGSSQYAPFKAELGL